MKQERLREQRSRLIARVSGLLKERDREIRTMGFARESTAKKIAEADAEVREIELELSETSGKGNRWKPRR